MNFIRKLVRYGRIVPESIRIYRLWQCTPKGGFHDILNAGLLYELVVNSYLGGGTERFLRNYLEGKKRILVLTSYLYGPAYVFILENTETKTSRVFPISQFAELLACKQIESVTINTFIRNRHLFSMMEDVVSSALPFRYLVHDYFCICQNFNLMAGSRMCNFDCANSIRCFTELNKLWLPPPVSPDHWHCLWEKFLDKSAEIRFFSKASRELVIRVYPRLQTRNITVVPHSMDYCRFTPISYRKDKLRVGIVGAISSVAKGRDIVLDFLRYARNRDFEVVVIGSYRVLGRPIAANIKYLGPYKHSQLQDIIEQMEVNSVLFPSICSETFSYLVSEQMMMDIPIVCFDLGAQAEKIRSYYKGVICTSLAPEEIHRSLLRALQLPEGEHP